MATATETTTTTTPKFSKFHVHFKVQGVRRHEVVRADGMYMAVALIEAKHGSNNVDVEYVSRLD